MTKANCIIFIFIIKMLFGGNNCLIISLQEQWSDNMRITDAMFNMELKIPLLHVGLTSFNVQYSPQVGTANHPGHLMGDGIMSVT